MIWEDLVRGLQSLLHRFGIFARVGFQEAPEATVMGAGPSADPERRRPPDLRRRDRISRPGEAGQARTILRQARSRCQGR